MINNYLIVQINTHTIPWKISNPPPPQASWLLKNWNTALAKATVHYVCNWALHSLSVLLTMNLNITCH